MRKRIIQELLVKNVLLIVLLILLYSPIHDSLINSGLVEDKPAAGDILLAASIIAVIACFGNFEFTYEKSNMERDPERILAHAITALLMLAIGISLIFTSILASFIMGSNLLFNLTLVALYLASCTGYDIWDVLRVLNK